MTPQAATRWKTVTGQTLDDVWSRSDLDESWKMDPVLELWVDVEGRPATLRLSGLLDERTGRNVRGVVRELLADGHVEMAVDVTGLEVRGGAGFATLVDLEQDVRRAGGRMHWDGWPALRIVSDEREARAAASEPAAQRPAVDRPASVASSRRRRDRVVTVGLAGVPPAC